MANDTQAKPFHKVGDKVRVWWPPTADEDKTGFAGMYWPVVVTGVEDGGYKVLYDNGESEFVKSEHVHPSNVPVEWGREGVPLQVCIWFSTLVLGFVTSCNRSWCSWQLPQLAAPWGTVESCSWMRGPETGGVRDGIFWWRRSVRGLCRGGVCGAQIGEFVEVFNDSSSDPAAWLGKIKARSEIGHLVRSRLFRVLASVANRLHYVCVNPP